MKLHISSLQAYIGLRPERCNLWEEVSRNQARVSEAVLAEWQLVAALVGEKRFYVSHGWTDQRMTRANDAQSAMVRIRAIISPVLFLIECVRICISPDPNGWRRGVFRAAFVTRCHYTLTSSEPFHHPPELLIGREALRELITLQWSLRTSCHHVYDLQRRPGVFAYFQRSDKP